MIKKLGKRENIGIAKKKKKLKPTLVNLLKRFLLSRRTFIFYLKEIQIRREFRLDYYLSFVGDCHIQ